MAAAPAVLAVIALVLGAGAARPGGEAQARQARQHLRAGEKALRTGRVDAAERELARAIVLDPLQVEALAALGQLRMRERRFGEAVEAFERGRDAALELRSRERQGEIDHERRRDEEIRQIRDAVSSLRVHAIRSALAQHRVDRLEAQAEELERSRGKEVTDAPPVPAPLLLSLGSAHFRLGQMSQAESAYRSALEVDDDLGEAHNNLAVIYFMSGRLDLAEEAVRRAERTGFRIHPQFKSDLAKAHDQATR